MDSLLSYIKEYFDYVIIDTPPVNVVSDAVILAEKITGFVFVVQNGKNHFNELNYSLETIRQMNGNVVGFILNDATGKSSAHYSSYRSRYSYYGKNYYRRGGYSRGYYGNYGSYVSYYSSYSSFAPKDQQKQNTTESDKKQDNKQE